MNVGVVGYGVVGKAVTKGFRNHGHQVYVNDIQDLTVEGKYNFTKQYLMHVCNLIFLCVPTPMMKMECCRGNCDLTHVYGAIKGLEDGKHVVSNPLIVIKSTVPPRTTAGLTKVFPVLRFAYNPEFLRAKTAVHDFLNPDRIIIGAFNQRDAELLTRAYKNWSCPLLVTDPTTAETIKYVANAFLTAKVAFACEVAEACKALDVDVAQVMAWVAEDRRINPSHLNPTLGPIAGDSPCLPKDLMAFIKSVEKRGYNPELLKSIYKVGVLENVGDGRRSD